MSTGVDLFNGLASAVVLVALFFLFAAGLRLPVARAGWYRRCAQGLVILGSAALTLFADMALYRHDVHFDVTHERPFTPSPEARQTTVAFTAERAQYDTSFFWLGVEHILTGYDHLLFLVAILLRGGQFVTLVKIVTAFTLAHSLTLAVAVLGLVALQTAWWR